MGRFSSAVYGPKGLSSTTHWSLAWELLKLAGKARYPSSLLLVTASLASEDMALIWLLDTLVCAPREPENDTARPGRVSAANVILNNVVIFFMTSGFLCLRFPVI